MSFFQSIGDYQNYLQTALNNASNQQALSTQSQETEQGLQNEDNIANEELKSSGLSDLFLGSPVAIQAITRGREIYSKARDTYGDIKKTYASLKEKAQAAKDYLTTAPEKIKALQDATLGKELSPEELTTKMTELFGEKIAKSPVGEMILNKVQSLKEFHQAAKASATEHLEAGNRLADEIGLKSEKLKDLISTPKELLTQSQIELAGHLQGALEKAHKTILGGAASVEEELSAKKNALMEAFKSSPSKLESIANMSETGISNQFEKLKAVGTKLSAGGETMLAEASASPLAEVRKAMPRATTQEFSNAAFQPLSAEPIVSTKFQARQFGEKPEPKIEAPKNAFEESFSNIGGMPLDYEHLSKIGATRVPVIPEEAKSLLDTLGEYKTKAASFFGKISQGVKDLGESKVGGILKGVGGVALDTFNVAGGAIAAEQLAKGKVSAQNLLGASQLKEAPAALKGGAELVQKGVSSVSEKAGSALSSYAEKAKAAVTDTMDMLKSSVLKTGEGVATKVGEGIAEKGLGDLALEAGIGAIPIVGEIADIGLGVGAVVSAVKDLFHKADKPVAAPVVTQGVQISRQAGVY